VFGEGFGSFHGLPGFVSWGWPAILRAGWASRAGLGGFGCTRRTGGLRAEVAEPPADPGRGEPMGLAGSLPGSAEVFGEGAGEAELGMGSGDQLAGSLHWPVLTAD
jgi:hypothetical protein